MTGGAGPDTFATTLPTPEPPNVSGALDQIETFLRGRGVDARTLHHVMLGIDELLANVASHGGAPHLPATLRLDVGPDLVRAKLEDEGGAYDPRGAPTPSLDGSAEERQLGGLGLLLLRRLAETIDYARQEGRNVTSFVIRRAQQEENQGTAKPEPG